MKPLTKFAVGLLVLFGLLPFPSSAQVQRIVIGPAISETAKILKSITKSAREAGEAAEEQLYYFYGERGFEPLWISNVDGTWQISPKVASLTGSFAKADELGLISADYSLPEPTIMSAADAVAYELAVTSAALQFGLDNYGGRIEPRSLSSNLDISRPRPSSEALFSSLGEEYPGRALTALAPQDREFQALLKALKEFSVPAPVVQIAKGASLKPGAIDDRVPSLRERLGQPTAESSPLTYDTKLVDAVRAFQASVGLAADGIVGEATRDALNRAGHVTRDQILVNLEKWRWLPRERGTYRVEVNIPEYRLWVRRDTMTVYETRVVVGTPSNQTPIFYDQIRHVVVNPYWNVPASIARAEIGPQVRRDPGYVARRELELLKGGEVVDPWTVDWEALPPGSFPFAIRQKPGTQNALGKVKFLFPNKHDVYLHDTPERSLFSRDRRAYSHGCVRVENPFDFASALLANERNLNQATLVDALGPSERWFNMEVKVPVYLTYFTVRVEEDGTIRSFADIYGHDATIARALARTLP